MQNVKQCIHAEQARWRVWFWAACELFVLFSMMRSLRIGPLSDALVCLLVGIGVLLNKDYQDDRRLRILFAVLFSISVSALWEFYEYGMDRWFGTDMQRDTLVTAIRSYDLGDAVGVIGSIDQIDSVIVNGVALEGYIDIGLIDTMGDMMIETAGAVVYAVVFALDRGRHPAFTRVVPSASQAEAAHAHVW